MLSLIDSPVLGREAASLAAATSQVVEPIPATETAADGPPLGDLFARLVRIVQRNEILFARRDALRAKLARARADLVSPTAPLPLARAYFQHLKLKHSAVIVQLRANRLEGQALLAALDPGASGTP